MINNALFRKAVNDSKMTVDRLSKLTGIPKSKIESLMKDGDTINATEIQALSTELKMSDALRRNVFFNRNLPLN